MLAHMTANGAVVRTGDLFASGTVSGASRDQRGSLIELTWNGAEPLTLQDGSSRSFLEDGDEVTISARLPSGGSLGAVSGQVLPAHGPSVAGCRGRRSAPGLAAPALLAPDAAPLDVRPAGVRGRERSDLAADVSRLRSP
jgi:hypothetical protein